MTLIFRQQIQAVRGSGSKGRCAHKSMERCAIFETGTGFAGREAVRRPEAISCRSRCSLRQDDMVSRDWRHQMFELQPLIEDEEVLVSYA
ncbi:hypothetical protein [Candidatus Binatus sp.]|uniref:hypothetical protein n=1 Tax=Candidatus Binatus sp. TaxID=2811406 RepID=UPI003BAE6481